jgi:hypothetical protein
MEEVSRPFGISDSRLEEVIPKDGVFQLAEGSRACLLHDRLTQFASNA